MQGMEIKMIRRLRIKIDIGIVIPVMALFLFAGCATKGKVKPTPVAQKPPVVRLDHGREGFVITEDKPDSLTPAIRKLIQKGI